MTPSARRLAAAATAAVLVAGMPAPAAAQSADDQWWHEQWRMAEVWAITDGTGITVALIDSGVEATLPELSGAVLPGIELDNPEGDGHTDRDDGHGTAMASLIVGNGTGTGIRGVAPGATILPIAYPEGGALDSRQAWADAIRLAADEGADVINMSLGNPAAECPEDMADAVRYAIERDAIVVAASGNHLGGSSDVPGSCPGVLTVGASDPWLEPWENSHRSEHVDVAAPGYAIPAIGRDGQTNLRDGTSRATALASGAIALVRAHHPDANADEILTRIIATTRDIHHDGRDDATGHGLLRPYHALTETIPPNATNPIFETLPAPPTSNPTPTTATSPATTADTDTQGTNTALILTTAVLLLAAGAGLTLLLLRRRTSAPRG